MMELSSLLYFLLRRSWMLLLCMIAAAAAAHTSVANLPPRFMATTTLLLNPISADGEASYDSLMVSQQLAKTYSRMLTQSPVIEAAAKALSLDRGGRDLAKDVKAEALPNTSLITVSAYASSAADAERNAQAVATAFIEQNQKRESDRFDNAIAIIGEQFGMAHNKANLPGQSEVLRNAATEGLARTQIALAISRDRISVVERTSAIDARPSSIAAAGIAAVAGLLLGVIALLTFALGRSDAHAAYSS